MRSGRAIPGVVTVSLNTAIDRVFEVPGLEVGRHVSAAEVSRSPAGKGINVSLALAGLGRASIATGFVGERELGVFERHLAEAGLSNAPGPGRAASQLLSVRGSTRENLTLLDPDRGTDTHLRTTGFEVGEADKARLAGKLGLLARAGTAVVFGGSLPPGMGAADLADYTSLVRGAGALVAIDIGPPMLDAWIAQHDPLREPVWLVRINSDELPDSVIGGAADDRDGIVSAARKLSEMSQWAVVSLGEEGAVMARGGGVWRGRLPVDQRKVVSTVGCGDCMHAGLIDAILSGVEPEQVLTRGLSVAAAKAMCAQAAMFDRDTIGGLAQQAIVESIA